VVVTLQSPPLVGKPRSIHLGRGFFILAHFGCSFDECPVTTAPRPIHVKVGEIIVTLPSSDYTVTYHKPPNSTGLLAKNFSKKDDGRVALTQAEFLALAWRLANEKARELGWIV
jgi:hypothetical protein